MGSPQEERLLKEQALMQLSDQIAAIGNQISEINLTVDKFGFTIAQEQLDLAVERETQTNIGIAITNLNNSLTDLESQLEETDPSDPNYISNIDLIAQQISSTNDFISRLNEQLNQSNATADSLSRGIAIDQANELTLRADADAAISNLTQQQQAIYAEQSRIQSDPNPYVPPPAPKYFIGAPIVGDNTDDINTGSNQNNIVDNSADIDANTNAFYDAGPIIYVDDTITEDPDVVAMDSIAGEDVIA